MMFSRIQMRLYLKVWTGDALGDLLEERLLDLDELSGLDHVEDLLDLTQEHHLKIAQSYPLCYAHCQLQGGIGLASVPH